MKFRYYDETDSLYIELSEKPSVDSKEIADGMVLDFDQEGKIVGIDIDRASRTVNLSLLETKGMPLTHVNVMQA